MPRHSYREHDYSFGQAMLTLRQRLRLTQADLAKLLGVTRRAIGEWETGSNYPREEHLQHLIELCVQQHVFPAEREEEEIRALWKTAHQRMFLDEAWLSALLARSSAAPATIPDTPPPGSPSVTQPAASPLSGERVASRDPSVRAPLMDWVGALDVSRFTGREAELAELSHWIVQERCRLVAILGMGGIGKSALVSLLGKHLAPQFDAVLWRSLRDAPPCEDLVADCLTFFADTPPAEFPASLEQRINQLIGCLQARRCLLVLDNLEVLLQEGDPEGSYRRGYEGYGRLIERLGESAHQSCVVLTSREKPRELEAAEGLRGPVRSLRLSGLSGEDARSLLSDKDLHGDSSAWQQLIANYAGNPLALKIVGQAIVDLFAGDIVPFLHSEELIFNGIRMVLRQQVARLTPLEQMLLTWLAVVREWTSLDAMLSLLVKRPTHARVLEALEALWRRSLIERGRGVGFTLQSVVMEYISEALLEQLAEEIRTLALDNLDWYALEQAQAKDYVRQTQVRMLVRPLLEQLRAELGSDSRVEDQLLSLLRHMRTEKGDSQGYGPANVISLLKALRGDLRGLDLSRLAIRGAYLQGVEMQDAMLSEAVMRECVFTQAFDAISAVAISRGGRYWAAISRQGEVRVWREEGKLLHRAWQAHSDMTLALALSPDEHTLASGSYDGSVKLWDVETGALLWFGWHMQGIMRLAFSPDGSLLASGGVDATARLWDAKQGTLLEDLPHPSTVTSLAWSPDGRLLASSDFAGTIRLWAIPSGGRASCVQTLAGHRMWVRGLAIVPDGSQLVSASWDGTLKLWDLASGRCLQTLVGHTERVHCLALSPDGGTLASGGWDTTIRLWDAKLGTRRAVLQGHSDIVESLAFTPESGHLLSGSDDGTLRLWEVDRAQCVRVIQGSVASLTDLDWSPDGRQLVSGGTDTLVTIWDVADGRPARVLRGHRWRVNNVGWSPDGSRLVSSGSDSAMRLWDPTDGSCLQVLGDPDHPDTLFYGVAFSPDGTLLVGGTFQRGALVWDMSTRSLRWTNREHRTWLRRVAWSPDGTHVAGGGDDGSVFLWEATDGTLQRRLAGYHGAVMNVAWSPDGRRLASVGSGREGAELFVWEVHSGQRMRTLVGQPGLACAVAWSLSGEQLVSGGDDGMLRWWEVQSGECVRVREAHQGTVQALKRSPDGRRLASCGDDGAIRLWDLESGEPLQTLRRDRLYERLNITDIRGLTEAQQASLHALGAFEETNVGK